MSDIMMRCCVLWAVVGMVGAVGAAVLPQEPTASEKYAAEEYAKWTAQLTGAKAPELEIRRDAALGEDGFRLQNAGGKLVVSGGRRGVLYGVYEALERFGGIEWLARHATVVPKNGALVLPDGLDETQRPAFEMRQPFWFDAMEDPDFAARLKINAEQLQERHGGCSHLFDSELRNCHTFEKLVPQAQYFAAHPEYYSEWEGKRRGGKTQLCLTNPDVLKIVTAKVLERIAANPKAKYFGVSQNDWGFYCTCTNCAAIDAEEESHAGALVRFVNAIADEVAKRYPDKVVETLAYQWSRKPPKKTRLRPNVMPCLCSIECEFYHPLAKSKHPQNISFLADLRGWAAQTDQLYVWDYTTDFADYLYPFANVYALQENIKTFRANKVKSLFEQGAYQGRHADFAELKTWLISKWLWNPDAPMEPLLKRFFEGYYGAAAPAVRRYFDLLHAIERDHTGVLALGIYESPLSQNLSDEFLTRASALWDEAEALVKDDPLRAYNVRMGRLTVDTTRLQRHRDAAKRWPEYRALAKRVLAAFDEAKDIRFAEPLETTNDALGDWRQIASAESYETAVKTWKVAFSNHKNPVIAVDRFLFETGKAYTLRVHVRGGGGQGTDRPTDGGVGFEAGVDDWDSVLNHGKRRVEARDVPAEGAWFDVLTWQTRQGEYFWFRPLDDKTEIDGIELVHAPAAYPVKREIWPAGKIPMNDYTGYAPYYFWYDPTNRTSDAILISCSGGGYWGCGTGGFETKPLIDYMLARGVTCVEFRYRPRAKGHPKHLAAWQDAQRLVRIVRHEARRRGMATDRIGFSGGSAGGHLTIMAAVSSTTNSYTLIGDEIDQESCALNFAVPVYPAYGMSDVPDGCARSDDLAIPIVDEFLFDRETPPMCFFHGGDDGWTPMTSLRCWHKLRTLHIPAELHALSLEGHCFQYRPRLGTPAADWKDILWSWLVKMDFVTPHPRTWEYRGRPFTGKKWFYPLLHQYLTNVCDFAEGSWKGDGMGGGYAPVKPGCELRVKKPLPRDCEIDFDFQPFGGVETGVYVGKVAVAFPPDRFDNAYCHRVTLRRENGAITGYVNSQPIDPGWLRPAPDHPADSFAYFGMKEGEKGFGRYHHLRWRER